MFYSNANLFIGRGINVVENRLFNTYLTIETGCSCSVLSVKIEQWDFLDQMLDGCYTNM